MASTGILPVYRSGDLPSGDPFRLFFPPDGAGEIRVDLDMHFECLIGKEFLDVLRPFHQAQVSAVQVVVETDVDSLGDFVDAVEIKVIDGLSVPGHIFVDDGESR